MKVHNRNSRGGSVQIKKEIFDDVHAMVQLHRQSKGLAPWDFINRKAMKTLTVDSIDKYFNGGNTPEEKMKSYTGSLVESESNMNEEQYTTKEVADAIKHLENKNGSVRVKVQAGEKKVKCECQCGGYVPVGNVMQGWTYIYGHKNASGARNNSGKQHRLPITRGQAYEPLLDRIRMDIVNVESEMKNVTLEAQKLTAKLQTLKQDLDKLKAAEQALKPLVTTSNNGAH